MNLNDPIDTTWIKLPRGTLPEFLTHNIFSYNKMIIVLYQYGQIDITHYRNLLMDNGILKQ